MAESNRRKIRLTYLLTGESVVAEMLDDEAPEVCRIVWDLLPVEGKVLHGMYSGAEVFLLLDRPVWYLLLLLGIHFGVTWGQAIAVGRADVRTVVGMTWTRGCDRRACSARISLPATSVSASSTMAGTFGRSASRAAVYCSKILIFLSRTQSNR